MSKQGWITRGLASRRLAGAVSSPRQGMRDLVASPCAWQVEDDRKIHPPKVLPEDLPLPKTCSSDIFAPKVPMNPTEYFKWWSVDERTGERRTTTYKLSRADAKRIFPGAKPVLETREIRYLGVLSDPPSVAKPHDATAQL